MKPTDESKKSGARPERSQRPFNNPKSAERAAPQRRKPDPREERDVHERNAPTADEGDADIYGGVGGS